MVRIDNRASGEKMESESKVKLQQSKVSSHGIFAILFSWSLQWRSTALTGDPEQKAQWIKRVRGGACTSFGKQSLTIPCGVKCVMVLFSKVDCAINAQETGLGKLLSEIVWWRYTCTVGFIYNFP